MNKFFEILPDLENKAKRIKGLKTKLVSFPISLVPGIFDIAVYDTEKNKFIELQLHFAVDDDDLIIADWMPENTAYCNDFEIVTIKL